jgi:catechol 2,3-dioxygenase-like lactoylglutathione lyase family enzyme
MMKRQFNDICLVTQNVRKLRDFYQDVFQVQTEESDTFVAFEPVGVPLTLYHLEGMEQMAPGSMRGAGAGSNVLEFEVENVDQEYDRLLEMNVPIVKPPTTQPWGLRSVWFRDPDGNIVNFFTAVNRPTD